MNGSHAGLYLYQKEFQDAKVLKEMLQFLRTTQKSTAHSFSYIEAELSLHPNLSLWENLKLETNVSNWYELKNGLKPECHALVDLLNSTERKATDTKSWEKLVISLLKGMMNPSQHLLVDINEDVLDPFIIKSIKYALMSSTRDKSIYLASSHSSLWLDCCHTLVKKVEYRFETELLDAERIKKHWAA